MARSSLRITAQAALAGLALAVLPMSSFGFVSVGVSITVAPPALPVYVQPPCPAVGYIWTPGYWAWDDGDYYWVPGTWILPPSVGLLWTPGYWGWSSGFYVWHTGYWGPHVGFYGGVNYGYGYTGVGFEGGYWRGGAFYYNRSVSNLGSINVTHVYNRTVVNNITVNRISYNGGDGGLHARPSQRDLAAEHERHVEFTNVQREHEHMAFGNRDLRASVNGGKPRIAATERPAVFSGRGIVAARAAGAPYRPDSIARGSNSNAAGTNRPVPGHGPDLRQNERDAGGLRTDRPNRPQMAEAAHGSAMPRSAMPRSDRPPTAHAENSPRFQEGPRAQMNARMQESPSPQTSQRMQESARMHEAPHSQMGARMQESPRIQEGSRPQMSPRMQEGPRPEMHSRMAEGPRPEMHARLPEGRSPP